MAVGCVRQECNAPRVATTYDSNSRNCCFHRDARPANECLQTHHYAVALRFLLRRAPRHLGEQQSKVSLLFSVDVGAKPAREIVDAQNRANQTDHPRCKRMEEKAATWFEALIHARHAPQEAPSPGCAAPSKKDDCTCPICYKSFGGGGHIYQCPSCAHKLPGDKTCPAVPGAHRRAEQAGRKLNREIPGVNLRRISFRNGERKWKRRLSRSTSQGREEKSHASCMSSSAC